LRPAAVAAASSISVVTGGVEISLDSEETSGSSKRSSFLPFLDFFLSFFDLGAENVSKSSPARPVSRDSSSGSLVSSVGSSNSNTVAFFLPFFLSFFDNLTGNSSSRPLLASGSSRSLSFSVAVSSTMSCVGSEMGSSGSSRIPFPFFALSLIFLVLLRHKCKFIIVICDLRLINKIIFKHSVPGLLSIFITMGAQFRIS